MQYIGYRFGCASAGRLCEKQSVAPKIAARRGTALLASVADASRQETAALAAMLTAPSARRGDRRAAMTASAASRVPL
eukprot:454665-Pleurochrysis_carterae.AAC.1